MSWEKRLVALFDDLEQQAEGMALAQRDAEVADLSRQEYAGLDLAARLHGSGGAAVRAWTAAGPVHGRLVRAGDGWFLLSHDGGWPGETLVRVAAVRGLVGLSERTVHEHVRPVTARLGAGGVLRAVAETGEEVAVADLGGQRRRGVLRRVGADFLELAVGEERVVVPFEAIALVERS